MRWYCESGVGTDVVESVCELLGLPVDATDGDGVRGAQLLDAVGGFGFRTARGRGAEAEGAGLREKRLQTIGAD